MTMMKTMGTIPTLNTQAYQPIYLIKHIDSAKKIPEINYK